MLEFTGLYFVLANGTYLALLLMSWFDLRQKKKNKKKSEKMEVPSSVHSSPTMTLMIPAFNEEKVIVEALRAHLSIDYENLEFIVVDDGSTDNTAALIAQQFEMEFKPIPRRGHVSKAKIYESFRSTKDPRLWLIRQENRGKAGALNTALDHSNSEFCCTADADTIPERDSVLRLVQAFDDSEQEIVAAGGTVRIANGAQYENHHIVRGKLPNSLFLRFQIIEYIRAFFCGRSGWEWVQSTVLLSGAMAAFRTKAIQEVNGFDESSITEDLEIILRLRWQSVAHKKNWGIRLIPEPICWTQAPASIGALRRQRIRWQQGLSQTMWKYFSLILNPTYGTWSLFHMPYMLCFEWIGPWIELTAYVAGLTALCLGFMDPAFASLIIGIGVAYSLLVSVLAIHFEEYYFARHRERSTKFKFLTGAILENFGYRQLTWFFRLEASLRMLFQKPKWGQQTRYSLSQETNKVRDAA